MRTFVLVLIILVYFPPCQGQEVKFQKNIDNKVPELYVKKKVKRKVYKINNDTMVRLKTYNSEKAITGKIYEVKDSSILVNKEEILIKDIKSIKVNDGIMSMCIVLTPFTYGTTLIFIPLAIT